jgi:predicted nucleic acid-binding protein
VILVDANLLVYAHVTSLPQHDQAHAWLDLRLNGVARVGLPALSG